MEELEIALEEVISEWTTEREAHSVVGDLEKREQPERAQPHKKARLSGNKCLVSTLVATALPKESPSHRA